MADDGVSAGEGRLTVAESTKVELHDVAPARAQMRREVLAGLHRPQKTTSPKFLYDRRGSQLFDRICELDEYYPTRTELAIMKRHVGEMASLLGPGCLLIEFGSGSSLKTRILLDHLDDLAIYVPVDISRGHLLEAAEAINADYPALDVLPVCADFTKPFTLPPCDRPVTRRVVYLPGSTIGNLSQGGAAALLADTVALVGNGGGLLIGVDLKKDPAVLERAYNDAEGVTAAFNKNLLRRLNRELDADFDLDTFRHKAIYNAAQGRIEMHLVSDRDQAVRVDGEEISFAAGETIHTENSHKFTLDGFAALARPAGWKVRHVWTDPDRLFSVQYLTAEPRPTADG